MWDSVYFAAEGNEVTYFYPVKICPASLGAIAATSQHDGKKILHVLHSDSV